MNLIFFFCFLLFRTLLMLLQPSFLKGFGFFQPSGILFPVFFRYLLRKVALSVLPAGMARSLFLLSFRNEGGSAML